MSVTTNQGKGRVKEGKGKRRKGRGKGEERERKGRGKGEERERKGRGKGEERERKGRGKGEEREGKRKTGPFLTRTIFDAKSYCFRYRFVIVRESCVRSFFGNGCNHQKRSVTYQAPALCRI